MNELLSELMPMRSSVARSGVIGTPHCPQSRTISESTAITLVSMKRAIAGSSPRGT